jgi:hypothetical protein
MPLTREATAFIASHGKRAPQLLVDKMVAAVREGDEVELRAVNALAMAVERIRAK